MAAHRSGPVGISTVTTATITVVVGLQDPSSCSRPMAQTPVRVVGSTALKTLMAYGGTVLDLRDGSTGLDRLPERLEVCGAGPEGLILLVAADVPATLAAVAALTPEAGRCVVVVNAGPDPAAAAPAERPD